MPTTEDQQLLDEFRSSFNRFVINDLNTARKCGLEIGLVTLTVAAIDTLAGYYYGPQDDKQGNQKTFTEFVKRFMPSYPADALYECVRCGLVHASGLQELREKTASKNPTSPIGIYLTRDAGQAHLTPVIEKPGYVYINRIQLLEDFKAASEIYFLHLSTNPAGTNEKNNALNRLKQTGVLVVNPLDFPPPGPPPNLPTGMKYP